MSLIQHALAAGRAAGPRPTAGSARAIVVAGAGGALGSAVLAQLLAASGTPVHALTTGPIRPALRGFAGLSLADLGAGLAPVPDTGVIVFDRERHANGREAAFLRPLPEHAVDLAHALARAGVSRLVVVWPHAPATVPEALRHGLASLDEHALARLPFVQVVFVRSAQADTAPPAASPMPARLARWMLGQLRWMLPQRQQAVRPQRVAAFVAGLVRALPAAPHGTRVAATEQVWDAAQSDDPAQWAGRWLLEAGEGGRAACGEARAG